MNKMKAEKDAAQTAELMDGAGAQPSSAPAPIFEDTEMNQDLSAGMLTRGQRRIFQYCIIGMILGMLCCLAYGVGYEAGRKARVERTK